MKIRLDRIVMSPFSLREKMDEEHLNAITESFKVDGQWDPIIVRASKEKSGYYELIAGEYRVRAARKVGWTEIEATVKDLADEEADTLAIKTNLIRKSLEEIEEAKAVKKLIDKYEWSQRTAAVQLGVSPMWISNRLALVMRIIDEVQEALGEGKISMEHAVLISRLTVEKRVTEEGERVTKTFPDEKRQRFFLNVISERKLSRDEAREVLKWIQNDTIYTIGYEGKDLDGFMDILKESKVDVLIDVRESGKSRYRPEFNEDILAREFKKVGIDYERRPDLGVIYDVRTPYIEGYLSHDCFRQWYEWSVRSRRRNGEVRDLIPELVKDFKTRGRVCLMCEERYPKPQGSQKYYCHRDILLDLILQFEDKKEPLMKFEKRVDL